MVRTGVHIVFLFFGILSLLPVQASNLDSLRSMLDSLEKQHVIWAQQGYMEQAAKALYQYNDAAFRWQNLFDSIQVQEMKDTYQLDLRAAEIKVEEARLANQLTVMMVCLGIGALVLLAIWMFRRHIRIKAAKEAERFEESQLRKKAEVQLQQEQFARNEWEKAQLSEKLTFQQQRLTNQMLQLINKNQLLLHIQEKLNQADTQPNFIQELQAGILGNVNPEEDWATFLVQFEELYPDFFNSLKEINSDLTENDYKLAILLRLQLSSKEIAYLLGITPDSVKTARYRLGKKLALPQGEKLQDFLVKRG